MHYIYIYLFFIILFNHDVFYFYPHLQTATDIYITYLYF